MLDKPDAATRKEWRLWKEQAKKDHPVRYFLQEEVPHLWRVYIVMSLKAKYWWVMHRIHPKHRYHVIKPRTLEPNYHDPRELILHAAMDILADFVEFETTRGHVDWDGSSDVHAAAWKEMNEIYTWWTKERPVREEIFDKANPYPEDSLNAPFMWKVDEDYEKTGYKLAWDIVADLHNLQEIKWDEEDAEYLHRLINVRLFMWN